MSDEEQAFEVNDQNCQKVMDKFCEVTDTPEPFAMMTLQENDWNLERALASYFKQPFPEIRSFQRNSHGKVIELSSSDDEATKEPKSEETSHNDQSSSSMSEVSSEDPPSSSSKVQQSPVKKMKVTPTSTATGSSPFAKAGALVPVVNQITQPTLTSEPVDPSKLIFITWNIDGLCQKNRKLRTDAVSKMIKEIKPDVVFLQEVIEETESYLTKELDSLYQGVSGQDYKGFKADYYTLTLLRRETCGIRSAPKIVDFTSVMTRNLVCMTVRVKATLLVLMNSHLESTKDYEELRKSQMAITLDLINKESKDLPVIFAGDMNARDKEIGSLPDGVIDVWEATGSKRECEYTWDMLRNDNLEFPGKWKPRCRFDRIWIRDSIPSRLVPQSFNLIGLSRLKPFVCFPSDHWGILSIFRIKPTPLDDKEVI